MNNVNNSRRIVKNSLFLYFRMILTLLVTLYTSRVVLNTLGVQDFGIYNVVGGVVSMMAFLSGAMSTATQRFLSFELGKGDKQQLLNVFRMSINIHFLIILIVFLVAETVGIWFINSQLVIPMDRLSAANTVFQCALFSFSCTIMSVPYNAVIIAHEKMSVFAYISIFDVMLKLTLVFMLDEYTGDKLEFYSLLLALVSLVIFGIYYLYARWNFSMTRFNWYWNTKLFKVLFSYTGWNLFGNIAAVATNQGVNILINLFFGATVNAARAIAFQVNTAITGFVSSLQMAINPQIVKSYANGDHQYMLQLVFFGARYSFFLLYMIAVPLLLQTEFVLKMWLGLVPEHAANFCRLIIIDSLVISLSGTLMTAFQATGKIKKYQVIVGCIILCNLPISYIFLNIGFDAKATMIVAILISISALIARLVLLSKAFSGVGQYFKELLFRVLLVSSMSLYVALFLPMLEVNNISSFIAHCLLYWLIITFFILTAGLLRQEQKFLISRLSFFFKKA